MFDVIVIAPTGLGLNREVRCSMGDLPYFLQISVSVKLKINHHGQIKVIISLCIYILLTV